MKNFDVGYSWMPADHSAFPGYDRIFKLDLPPGPHKTVTVDGVTKIRYADVGLVCGTYKNLPETYPNGKIFFDLHTVEQKYFPHLMTNATSSGDAVNTKTMGHAHRVAMRKRGHLIFQDSGGFQLISGRATWVEPSRVAASHTTYADEGVGLDIPMAFITDVKLAKRAALVQNQNNAIIKKLSPKTRLFMTSHGVDSASRHAYLDVAMDSKFDGVCVAGLRPVVGVHEMSLPQQVLHMMYVIERTKHRVNRYHVLGVSTFSTMYLLSAIAHHYGVRITSDSSRHIMAGAGGSTLTDVGVKVIKFEMKDKDKPPQYLKHMCTCYICQTLKIDYPYYNTRFLYTHALVTLGRVSAEVNKRGPMLLSGTQVPYVSKDMDIAIAMLRTLKGEKQVLKELSRLEPQHQKRRSLFGGGRSTSGFEGHPLYRRISNACDLYEEFHRTGKSPIKEKKEKAK